MRIKEQQLTEDYIKATLDTIQLLNENKLTDMAKNMGKKLLAQLGIPAGKDYSELVNVFATKAEKSVQVLKADLDILKSSSMEGKENLVKQLESLMNQISNATANLKATVPPAEMIDQATEAAAESAGEEQSDAAPEGEGAEEGTPAEGTEATDANGAEAGATEGDGTESAEGDANTAEGNDASQSPEATAEGAEATPEGEGGEVPESEGAESADNGGEAAEADNSESEENEAPAADDANATEEAKDDSAEADDADKKDEEGK